MADACKLRVLVEQFEPDQGRYVCHQIVRVGKVECAIEILCAEADLRYAMARMHGRQKCPIEDDRAWPISKDDIRPQHVF